MLRHTYVKSKLPGKQWSLPYKTKRSHALRPMSPCWIPCDRILYDWLMYLPQSSHWVSKINLWLNVGWIVFSFPRWSSKSEVVFSVQKQLKYNDYSFNLYTSEIEFYIHMRNRYRMVQQLCAWYVFRSTVYHAPETVHILFFLSLLVLNYIARTGRVIHI